MRIIGSGGAIVSVMMVAKSSPDAEEGNENLVPSKFLNRILGKSETSSYIPEGQFLQADGITGDYEGVVSEHEEKFWDRHDNDMRTFTKGDYGNQWVKFREHVKGREMPYYVDRHWDSDMKEFVQKKE